MSSQKNPLARVTEEHGGKEKLVEKILGSLEPDGEEEKDDLRRRLLSASNKKLLRLVKNAQALKEKYGSKEKLVATVAGALQRAKDSDFVQRLEAMTQGRLLDMARVLGRRGEAAPAAAATETKAKAAAPKAKAPAKPKAAAKPKKAKAAAKKPAKVAAKKPAAKKKK